MLNSFVGSKRDARVTGNFLEGSTIARKARKRDKCEKNMDFGVLPAGAEGAKTFWGLSGVYKATTQKEKNWHPKIKIDTQFLWFWFWICFYICSYLPLKNWSFSNNLLLGGTNLVINQQQFKAHSYSVGQWSEDIFWCSQIY